MKKPAEMNTMVSVIEHLKSKGWDNEFRMTEIGCLCNDDKTRVYKPADLEIIQTYRFEGDSNPSDSSIIYVLKVKDSDLTGYCIDVYGAYSDDDGLEEFIKDIQVHRKEDDTAEQSTEGHEGKTLEDLK